MFALLASVAMYRVAPIALPAWYGVSAFDPLQDQIAPPAALGPDGRVALVLTSKGGASRIGIVRADGTTTYLELPSRAAITDQITVEDPPGFSAIVLADDGTPFVTVGSCFEAIGGGGCRQATFCWTGRWQALPHPKSSDQFEIAGAVTNGTYVIQDDYGNRSAVGDHNLDPTSAYRYDAGKRSDLGEYLITSMHGRFAAGTPSLPQNVMDPPSPIPSPAPPQAVLFELSKKTMLGPGVALAVNARGDVVGDDEATSGGTGRPTLWSHGTAITLTQATGTADAINDAGIIAGRADGHLFLTDARDPSRHIYPLDERLVDRSWHIEREFGIANDGRMLVIAHHGKGARQLVVLMPVPS